MLPIGSRRRSSINLNALTKLYRNGLFSDFTLNLSDGTLIRVHKIILGSASEYFARMFQRGFKETENGSIEIPDSPELVRLIIDGVYGVVPATMSLPDRLGILRILKFYQFYLLMDQLYLDLNDMEVPAEHFKIYVEMIELLYEEVTPEMMELVAKKVRPETDLSAFSDLFLEQIFSRDQFTKNFSDEIEVFWLIHGLVKGGHSKSLYRFVKFKNIDQSIQELLMIGGDLTEEMIEIRTRRLPLTDDLAGYLADQKRKALLVRVNREIAPVDDFYCFGVTGDGNQTEVILASPSKLYLDQGDHLKITNYMVRYTPDRIMVITSEVNKIK